MPITLMPTVGKSGLLATALSTTLFILAACGGGSGGVATRSDDPTTVPMSNVRLSVTLPGRLSSLDDDVEVIVTAGGDSLSMPGSDGQYALTMPLALNSDIPVFVRVQRSNDALILASAQSNILTSNNVVSFAMPPQLFTTEFDSDSDGFTNIAELERGSEPLGVSEDFDGDGIANDSDSDDDNDGIIDSFDAFPFNPNENTDTDGDGIGDNQDRDDDNDNIQDVDDRFPLDANESLDIDLDGLGNSVDPDDDGDGTIDLEDPQPANPNITGNEDSDGDGFRDLDDSFPYDASENNDNDGDGIGDNADNDDDGNGIPDDQDHTVAGIPFTNNPPIIDGAFGWSEWRDAARSDSRGNSLSINHLMDDPWNILTDQDWGNYSRWRAMHDGTHLYILVSVSHEPSYQRWSDSTDVWHDDSVEVFIDVGNDKQQVYGANDYQRLFRYQDNVADNQTDGANSAAGMISNYCSSRGMATDWAQTMYYEIKINMNSIGLNVGERFGIDIQYNDDDDSGVRDAKWGWFSPSGRDDSWLNPSLFGTGILAPEVVVTRRD